MGTREDRVQQERLWYQGEIAEAPGHPFYQRLNKLLDKAGFDSFCEEQCQQYYHEKLGRPSLSPGAYFRLMLIGFFEGLESERGIAWRVADSLSLRDFLRYGLDERTPDHVTISRTRRLMSEETHEAVFTWVLGELTRRGLLKGKTIGIDATTLEANAAMKSIVRRDTKEDYQAYLRRLAKSEGLDLDAAGLRRMDRKRKKKMSNTEWVNPNDPEAEITKMKDGTTRLAYKAEQAVDMKTGAIVAVTTHSGATGDTTSIEETLPAAGEAVAEQIATATLEGKFEVNAYGVEELVTDSGYYSDGVLMKVAGWGVRTYIAEPDRKARNWEGKEEERKAAKANQRRVTGRRGKMLMRQRGEKLERPFAHQYETGGMRRLHVRGRENVHKRVLLQAAACNLALLVRTLFGAGTPRGLHSRGGRLLFALICLFLAKLDAEVMQTDEFSAD